jgi:GntR family transcriptional regulator, rspAB operon transcriptional repressor
MILSDLPQNEDLSLSDKVFEALKQGILSLDIKPREYLLIRELAEYYDISRTPVREALIRLEHEGWVENDGRRGAKVVIPSSATVLEVVEIQAALESDIAYRAVRVLTDDQLGELDETLIESEKCVAEGDANGWQSSSTKFHRILSDAVGNRYMQNMIRELEDRVIRVRLMLWHKGSAPADVSLRQHREILDAIRSHNPEEAYRLMYHHTMWFEEELAAMYKNL